jgi:hypothetical protein
MSTEKETSMPATSRTGGIIAGGMLFALALLLASVASAADVGDDRPDSEWFASYSVDYYSPAQCDDALRFIRKTYGFRHIAILVVGHPSGSVDHPKQQGRDR